jgi:hypothetical protein
LLVRNILQNNPNHLESLYLSAVNWYHLEDRVKALLFLEQIFMIDPAYSPECYKMAAVCYSKVLEYARSLACVLFLLSSSSIVTSISRRKRKAMIWRGRSLGR